MPKRAMFLPGRVMFLPKRAMSCPCAPVRRPKCRGYCPALAHPPVSRPYSWAVCMLRRKSAPCCILQAAPAGLLPSLPAAQNPCCCSACRGRSASARVLASSDPFVAPGATVLCLCLEGAGRLRARRWRASPSSSCNPLLRWLASRYLTVFGLGFLTGSLAFASPASILFFRQVTWYLSQ